MLTLRFFFLHITKPLGIMKKKNDEYSNQLGKGRFK